MSSETMDALQRRVDAVHEIDAPLLRDVASELRSLFPGADLGADTPHDSTEAILHLVDRCLPGWTITLRGTATAPDGHWHCALRESGERDNDAVIGSGEGPTVGLALLRALVSVARFRS